MLVCASVVVLLGVYKRFSVSELVSMHASQMSKTDGA